MDIWQTILRSLQVVWVVLIIALIGNVIALNQTGPMASINFAMFVAVLSLLAAIYGLIACFVESLSFWIVLISVDAAASIFTFVSAVVLSAKLGATNCGNFDETDGWIGFGAYDTVKRCREIQASVVFMWFLWATFMATWWLDFSRVRRERGSVRSHGPGMSQVGV